MNDTVKKVVIGFLILLILISSFVYYNNYVTKSRVEASGIILERSKTATESIIETPTTEVSRIKVHVAGEVNSPGLYEAEAGSRVADLIELAGGGTANADLNTINIAATVNDGQQIYVKRISDISNSAADLYINSVSTHNSTALININTASTGELKSLPGIGDVLSGAIVDYRDKTGGFRTIDDIKNVSGIGEKRFEQIKDMITVN